MNAQGPILTFFVNGQPVSQINDPDYTSGEVGFYVETFDSPKAHIHYENLIIHPAENLPPRVVVLYQDDFTNPASGWPNELVFQDYYVGYHEPDFYHVEVHTPNDNAVVAVPGHTFDDFSAETRVQVSKANTAPNGDFRYGLAVRRAGNRYYAFAISPRSKTWYVLKSGADRQQVLSQGTQDAIHGLQSPDTLRVNAQGPTLTFFVNGQPVSQINDPDYTSGEVGFYVETFDSPKAHIHYDNLIIRPAGRATGEPTAGANRPQHAGCSWRVRWLQACSICGPARRSAAGRSPVSTTGLNWTRWHAALTRPGFRYASAEVARWVGLMLSRVWFPATPRLAACRRLPANESK